MDKKTLKEILYDLSVSMLLGILTLIVLNDRNPTRSFLTSTPSLIYIITACILNIIMSVSAIRNLNHSGQVKTECISEEEGMPDVNEEITVENEKEPDTDTGESREPINEPQEQKPVSEPQEQEPVESAASVTPIEDPHHDYSVFDTDEVFSSYGITSDFEDTVESADAVTGKSGRTTGRAARSRGFSSRGGSHVK